MFLKMTEIGVQVDASHKRLIIFYGLTTLLWQFPTIWLSLTISKGTRDTRTIFIVATYIGHAVMNGCESSYLTAFWYILSNLADRFRIINICLSKHVTETRDKEVRASNDCTFVRNVSMSHLKLVQIVETVSQANAVQFVLCTATFFVSMTVTAFMTYQVNRHSIDYGTPGSAVYFSVRLVYNSFLMYKSISIGSKIRKERKITQSLINKTIPLEQNQNVLLQFNALSNQISHSETVISCGLFTIDWTLLYTLTTALGTYFLLFESFNSIHTARN
ncbi:uncharacterized protein LOC119084416 [Bradysia coprophila]|uniref:uncharacterized protein LOC119084416 n=1 Tax=Bradysia coprophila TaxID=38358 RepID=UPI00187D79F7|nr:uncharacterized protein LOC119084416 [Bradysia coprophila]